MSDDRPVLDYSSPDTSRRGIPLAVRIAAGVVAIPTTFVAALLFGVVLKHGVKEVGWSPIAVGGLFAGASYSLWRLAGVLVSRRR